MAAMASTFQSVGRTQNGRNRRNLIGDTMRRRLFGGQQMIAGQMVLRIRENQIAIVHSDRT